MNALNLTRRQEIFSLAEAKSFLVEVVNSAYLLTVPTGYEMGVSRLGIVFTVVGYEAEDDSSSRTAVARYTQYSYNKQNSLDIVEDIGDNLWQVVEHFPFTHARVLNIYFGIQLEVNKEE